MFGEREMISIRQNLSQLEQCHQMRELVLKCYADAFRDAAQYAVDLDPALTRSHRQYMNALAEEIEKGGVETTPESRATARGLLRDYHDKAAEYLGHLREELAGTARALQEITESLTQTDDDHETRMRAALQTLRSIAGNTSGSISQSLAATASAIEVSLDEMQRKNQMTVSQFLTEIRMLHQRIDAMEVAASVDAATSLLNRKEMESQIRGLEDGGCCLLLVKAGGLRLANASLGREAGVELAAAFAKRLLNSLPEQSVVARWGEEDFVGILHQAQTDVIHLGKRIAENLGGSYTCLHQGKTVRTLLKVRMGVVDTNGEKPERVIARLDEFLG